MFRIGQKILNATDNRKIINFTCTEISGNFGRYPLPLTCEPTRNGQTT